MLTFLGGLLRVVFGFLIACLAAGLVQVLFAVTPTELVNANDDRLGVALNWGLLSATQIAVFAAPFALLAVIISESQGVRSFAFHALVAMAIAVGGFGLIFATESPTEATIVNSYAMAAYLTSGFIGGLTYWLFAGRRAHRPVTRTVRMESDRRSESRPTSSNRKADDKPVSGIASSQAGKPVAAQTENQRMAQQRSTGTVPATRPAPSAPQRDDQIGPPKVPKSPGETSA